MGLGPRHSFFIHQSSRKIEPWGLRQGFSESFSEKVAFLTADMYEVMKNEPLSSPLPPVVLPELKGSLGEAEWLIEPENLFSGFDPDSLRFRYCEQGRDR